MYLNICLGTHHSEEIWATGSHGSSPCAGHAPEPLDSRELRGPPMTQSSSHLSAGTEGFQHFDIGSSFTRVLDSQPSAVPIPWAPQLPSQLPLCNVSFRKFNSCHSVSRYPTTQKGLWGLLLNVVVRFGMDRSLGDPGTPPPSKSPCASTAAGLGLWSHHF